MKFGYEEKLPSSLYKWLENLLYQTGQGYNWTVGKASRSIMISFMIGSLIAFLDLLIYLVADSDKKVIILLIGFFVFAIAPFAPILKFKTERQDFISRIVFQSPEFIDILESELVYGNGSIEAALDIARKELDGELSQIMDQAYKHVLTEKSVIGALDNIIKVRINHPLYDQIVVAIKQYGITNRTEKMIKSLHLSAKTEVNSTIRKQTIQKNLFITIVSIGILVNLALLVGIPMITKMLGFHLNIG